MSILGQCLEKYIEGDNRYINEIIEKKKIYRGKKNLLNTAKVMTDILCIFIVDLVQKLRLMMIEI